MKYRKLFTIVSILIILIGVGCLWFSNQYSPELTTLSIVNENNGTIKYIPNYQLNFNGYIINVLGQTFISLGIGILIIFYITELLTIQDRKDFEVRLENFQKKTAEGAILSIFDTLIDESFYSIVRQDVIGLKLIRKNVNWSYIIKEENSKLHLKRVITYELHNLTSSKQTDIIKTSIGSNKHTTTLKHCFSVANEEMEMTKNGNDGGFEIFEKEIHIDGNSSININIEIEQCFNNGYIYECHATLHPLTDLTLHVTKPKNYSFELSQLLSSKLEKTTSTDELIIFKTSGAIYKGQAVEFYSEKNDISS